MKEEWLFHGAVVPIDVETTAALVAEIKRLIDVIGGMALAQPESDYERGFIDGMQKQMQSSVDKAVNRMTQPEQEPVAWWNDTGTHIDLNVSGRGTPLYTHPVKDLEDIDINITWNENSMRDFGKDELNFARAILRKAQEK